MHPALRTLMLAKCPCCDGAKKPREIFCDDCMALLAMYSPGLYVKLRNATGRVYDDLWMQARTEILKSKEHVEVYGLRRMSWKRM